MDIHTHGHTHTTSPPVSNTLPDPKDARCEIQSSIAVDGNGPRNRIFPDAIDFGGADVNVTSMGREIPRGSPSWMAVKVVEFLEVVTLAR